MSVFAGVNLWQDSDLPKDAESEALKQISLAPAYIPIASNLKFPFLSEIVSPRSNPADFAVIRAAGAIIPETVAIGPETRSWISIERSAAYEEEGSKNKRVKLIADAKNLMNHINLTNARPEAQLALSPL